LAASAIRPSRRAYRVVVPNSSTQAACPHGGQPQPVLNGHADRPVQLVRDGGHRTDGPADRHFRRRHGVIGRRVVKSVVGRRGDGQSSCSASTFDLSGHCGQRMLHGLKLVEGTPELHPLAGVRHREVARRIERTDDLVAARPRAATGQLVGHADVDRARVPDRQIERE